MSSNQSYQLPDLLNIISPLELRTNRHCRLATTASEQWISSTKELQTLISSENELLPYLRSAKIGLLAAVCFPTCDAPQLRILTDFMTLLFFTAVATTSRSPTTESACACVSTSVRGNWWESIPPVEGSQVGDSHGETTPDGIALLNTHVLLKHAVHSQLARPSGSASTSWKRRFAKSVESFHAAQLAQSERLLSNLNLNPATRSPSTSNPTKTKAKSQLPTVEEYLEMRRELYGSSMTFDIAEILQTFRVPELQPSGTSILDSIKRAAFDVIAWSTKRDVDMSTHWVLQDVVAYQNQTQTQTQTHDQANSNSNFGNGVKSNCVPNLVALLMHHRNLSLQGAMNVCGSMIRTAFDEFHAGEKTLLDSLNPNTPASGSIHNHILSWVWNASGSNRNSNTTPSNDQEAESAALEADVKRYIQALKDCIVGTVHWVYETELFFGKKGGEIRAFGWVFVDQVLRDET